MREQSVEGPARHAARTVSLTLGVRRGYGSWCRRSGLHDSQRDLNRRPGLHPALDSVLADKVQVQQVVLNLVRNAIEAMEQSDQRDLLIGTERGPDGMAIIKVADTGTGIAPEIADQLFQPFITTKSQGLGVGLSISRTIVESHGGRIWVESNPAGGTTFRFTLRAVSQEDVRDGD